MLEELDERIYNKLKKRKGEINVLEELNERLAENGYETVNVLDKENFNEVLGSLDQFEIAQLLEDETEFNLSDQYFVYDGTLTSYATLEDALEIYSDITED